jgi:hypothetical protein
VRKKYLTKEKRIGKKRSLIYLGHVRDHQTSSPVLLGAVSDRRDARCKMCRRRRKHYFIFRSKSVSLFLLMWYSMLRRELRAKREKRKEKMLSWQEFN